MQITEAVVACALILAIPIMVCFFAWLDYKGSRDKNDQEN